MKHALAAAGSICAVALSLSAFAATAAAPPAPAGPSEGSLWTMDGKKVVDVPLKHTDVRIRVSGYVAEVDVTQTFHNPYDRKIEAVYAFPLPTGAAVNRLRLTTGGETVAGTLHRRDEAGAIYKAAKEAGKVAALLEEERANLFTQSVANIEPGAEVVVAIHYVQEVPYDHGTYELVFPMVASPRYVPGAVRTAAPAAGGKAGAGVGSAADTERVPDASRVTPLYLPPDTRSSHDIFVLADIEAAGLPLHDISSPSHTIATEVAGPGCPTCCCAPRIWLPAGATRVTLGAGDTIPNKDFVLRWRLDGAAPAATVLTHRGPTDATGAFFLMIEPPLEASAPVATPRELVFVLDTSSSMEGKPLAKAKEVVKKSLHAMGPDDTFQIVRFSDRASALGPKPLAASKHNVDLALAWVDGLAAAGGTEMLDGVKAALDFPHDAARLRIVLFLTDGYIGNEDEVLAAVHARLGASRLFSFGVGTAVNRYLLEEMAALGRGAVEVVRPDEDTAAAVERFHARIARPVLTDLRLDWKGLAVSDVVPAEVPDLFLGQPLVVHGRYAKAGAAKVELSGLLGGRRVTIPLDVTLPEREDAHAAVSTVWAKARIRELSRALLKKDDPKIVEAATVIALQNELLSKWTSFVAVSTKTTKGGPAETVGVPLEAPDGLVAGSGGKGTGKGTWTGTPAGASKKLDVLYDFGEGSVDGDSDSGEDARTLGGDGAGPSAPPPTKPTGGPGMPTSGEEPDAPAARATIETVPVAGVAHAASGGLASAEPVTSKIKGKPIDEKAAKAPKDDLVARAHVAYAGAVHGCYEAAKSRKVPLGKGVSVHFEIGADGRVASAAAAGAKDAALDDCLTVAARDVVLAPPALADEDAKAGSSGGHAATAAKPAFHAVDVHFAY